MVFNGSSISIILAIVVSVLCVAFVGGLIASYVYKRKHNIPTGACAECHSTKKSFVDEYHQKYKSCCCSEHKEK